MYQSSLFFYFFFFQAADGIRDLYVTGVQTCSLPIYLCCCCSNRSPSPNRHPKTRPSSLQSRMKSPTRRRSTLPGSRRSEERRVGKECRSRWATCHEKKKGKEVRIE